MPILIVEDLTRICPINDILLRSSVLKTTPERIIAASANIVFAWNICFFSHHENLITALCPTNFSSCLPSHHSQIKVLDGEDEYYKLLSTVESIPEEEHGNAPPPTLSSGPLVSQSWASQPCQPVRQTRQTCRQTLQRNVLSVGSALVFGASGSGAE